MLDLNLPASRGAAEPGVRFARHELGFQADPETREWAAGDTDLDSVRTRIDV